MLQIRVLQLASDFKAELRPLSHAEGILNINWDLRELWKGGWGWDKAKKGVFIVYKAIT